MGVYHLYYGGTYKTQDRIDAPALVPMKRFKNVKTMQGET